MTLKIKSVGGGKYQVKNTDNGLVHAKGTTLTRAKKQVRLFGMMASRPYSEPANTRFKGRPKFGSGIE